MDTVDKQIECRESTRQETSPPPMIILEKFRQIIIKHYILKIKISCSKNELISEYQIKMSELIYHDLLDHFTFL